MKTPTTVADIAAQSPLQAWLAKLSFGTPKPPKPPKETAAQKGQDAQTAFENVPAENLDQLNTDAQVNAALVGDTSVSDPAVPQQTTAAIGPGTSSTPSKTSWIFSPVVFVALIIVTLTGVVLFRHHAKK